MSDVSQGPGWWLASDGRWYPPTAVPGQPPGAGGPLVGMRASLPGPAVPPTLGVVTQVAFLLVAGMNALLLVAAVLARSRFSDFYEAPAFGDGAFREWITADDRMADVSLYTFVVGLVGTAVFMAWSWRAHQASDRLRPGDRSYSKGFTIGAWFIPFVNLLLPRLVIGEIEKIAMAPRDGGVVTHSWRETGMSGIGWLWWIGHASGVILGRVAAGRIDAAVELGTGDAVLSAYLFVVLAAAAAAIGLVFGAVHVGRLSRLLSPESFATSNGLGTTAPLG